MAPGSSKKDNVEEDEEPEQEADDSPDENVS